MMSFLFISIIIGGFSQTPGYWPPEDGLVIEPEAQVLRDVLLDWMENFKSFSGSYSWNRIYYEPLIDDEIRMEQLDIEYRWQGDKCYAKLIDHSREQGNKHLIYSYINGTLGIFVHDIDIAAESSFREIRSDSKEFTVPYSEKVIMPPYVLFGHQLHALNGPGPIHSIEEFLAQGYSAAMNEGTDNLLKHWRGSYLLECLISRDGKIQEIRINTSVSIFPFPEHLREDYIKQYSYDILSNGVPRSKISYSDHLFTGNIWFPLSVSIETYFPTVEQGKMWREFYSDIEKANLTVRDEEYRKKLCSVAAKVIAQKMYKLPYTTYIKFHAENLHVNIPLDDNAFKINFPKGTYIFDESGELSYRYGTYNIIYITIASLVIISLAISIVVGIWMIRKRWHFF